MCIQSVNKWFINSHAKGSERLLRTNTYTAASGCVSVSQGLQLCAVTAWRRKCKNMSSQFKKNKKTTFRSLFGLLSFLQPGPSLDIWGPVHFLMNKSVRFKTWTNWTFLFQHLDEIKLSIFYFSSFGNFLILFNFVIIFGCANCNFLKIISFG